MADASMIGALTGLGPNAVPAGPAAPAKEGGKSFGDTLTELLKETDGLQKASDQTVQDFAAGKVEDVHEVMVAMNRADLSFRMMLEVRNKLLDAYQEVMRIQA